MKPEFTPFRQTPVWDENETFELTGKQLTAIQDMFKAYTPFVTTLEALFVENLNNGKITINYSDLQGNPMQKEDIEAMLKQYAEDMAANMKAEEDENQRAIGMAESAHSEMTAE